MTLLTDTHLYREIHQQPEVLRRLLDREEATATALADLMHGRGVDNVVIAARGTSDNAGRYAQYVLGSMNGLSVGLAAPSLFSVYNRPPRLGARAAKARTSSPSWPRPGGKAPPRRC
jgi:glucosamine--fructose-6-phosphate aminotransferase (isomerizing)